MSPPYRSAASYLQFLDSLPEAHAELASIRIDLSQELLPLIASHSDLLRCGVEVIAEGLERVECRLARVEKGLDGIDSTLSWGFGAVVEQLEKVDHTLRSPSATWAYEQWRIAQEAMRRRLFPEALRALDRAISGHGSNTGYELDPRFHLTKGLIHLRGAPGMLDLVDLVEAERSLRNAARCAMTDDRKMAGRALLLAGWSAYCQGKAREAEEATSAATSLLEGNSEAMYQLAKVQAHRGKIEEALTTLGKAVVADRRFLVRALADGAFQMHREAFLVFLGGLLEASRVESDEALRRAESAVQELVTCGLDPRTVRDSLRACRDLRGEGTYFGYLDSLHPARRVEQITWAALSPVSRQASEEVRMLLQRSTRLLERSQGGLTDQSERSEVTQQVCEAEVLWRSATSTGAILGAKRAAQEALRRVQAIVKGLDLRPADAASARTRGRWWKVWK
jgi:tetratricopeptide (TPR) repeat protein